MATLPDSILTAAAAAALVEQASLLAGVPQTAWNDANTTTQQAALDSAWLAIRSTPGYNLYGHTTDDEVHLAVTVEALVRLDMQADAGSTGRSRLRNQGVEEVQVGRVRERYGRRPRLSPATETLLAPYRAGSRIV